MEDEEYDFIVKFDADRDRSANRGELKMVLEYIQVIIEEGLMPE